MSDRPLVFLGGTCTAGAKWRDLLIPQLTIDYFNPVVDDWTEEAQKKEEEMKAKADIRLYCITSKMTGVFSIAEVVDDSNKCPQKTVLIVGNDPNGEPFTEAQIKSLQAVMKMVRANGAKVFNNLDVAARYLNSLAASKGLPENGDQSV